LSLTGWIVAVLVAFLPAALGAQEPAKSLDGVTHQSSLVFLQRDGTCVEGTIAKADAGSIMVRRPQGAQVVLPREALLEAAQGDALVFSARSSWADILGVHLYPREALLLTLKNGKQIRGNVPKVQSSEITLTHSFRTTIYAKSDIATVDYLRLRPETDNYDFLLEEAPWFVVFDPEFYARAVGLEGRMQVRLYDASKPEDDSPGIERCDSKFQLTNPRPDR
jgi:hypothetical protein